MAARTDHEERTDEPAAPVRRRSRHPVATAEGLARGVLGGAAYEAAHTEGGGLSQKEATALAETYTD
ncbi:hypothetical protein [Streptomyces sp. gb1(2016)]|uniref:Uncharacterized protein n=1 Tax=Streptomyces sp. gb1(2016) TaxID=1828321 RepID=A0A652KHI7_9ACTN|nr:hypothetical protein [Streptomyces sp. gb1(2016)]TXS23185.1 hypothetical protein EAO74_21255 [Streptomyces sp. gb1(2016)]